MDRSIFVLRRINKVIVAAEYRLGASKIEDVQPKCHNSSDLASTCCRTSYSKYAMAINHRIFAHMASFVSIYVDILSMFGLFREHQES